MALDVSTLVSYVNEQNDVLLTKSLFTARTSELILAEGTVYTGVKYAEKINILDTDAIFQNGAGCVRTSSGTTTLTQRQVTVGEIAVVEDICVKDLRKTYAGKKLAKGSRENAIPFEQEYTDLKTGKIAQQLEKGIWQGDTASSDANLKRFDGYIKLVDAAGAAIDANTAAFIASGAPIAVATGITEANVRAIVKAMWQALPAEMAGQEDIRIFCGWDTFNKFIGSYTDQNLFNFSPKGTELKRENGEVMIPGTPYILTAVHGLDATNRLFATRMRNMVAATDLENEEEKWEMIPDQFGNYLHYQVDFKYGVNFGFANEWVSFKLVP